MRTVHGLKILLRVPIAVEQDDRVRGSEVDALAAGTGAEEENAGVGGGVVEGADLCVTVVLGD